MSRGIGPQRRETRRTSAAVVLLLLWLGILAAMGNGLGSTAPGGATQPYIPPGGGTSDARRADEILLSSPGQAAHPHPAGSPDRAVSRLRLATYNIRWGLGADGVHDLERTARVLRAIDADIVLLNEVDINWRRSGNADQPAYLAAAAGYPHVYFGPALRTWASGRLGLSLYGNALLSRFPLENTRTVPLPAGPGREPRAAVLAEVELAGATLTVLGTHLGLNRGDRLAQTARLAALAGSQAGPVVLMGDFNAEPEAPEVRQLLDAGLVDAFAQAGAAGSGFTFPTGDPRVRIDYVLVSPDLAPRVVAAGPLAVDASDHLPVVVDLDWPARL